MAVAIKSVVTAVRGIVSGLRASGGAGVFAPGNGCGLGVAPLLAHPATMTDASNATTSHAERSVILMSVYRRNPLVA
jgi:hypothetical protein